MQNIVQDDKLPSFNLHQNILEHIPGFVAVTDMQMRAMYTNAYTARAFGYSSVDEMIGTGPYDMRCPAVESVDLFVEQEKIVRKNQKQLSLLDIHVYSDGLPKILYTKKNPYYENGVLAGSVFLCTEMYIDSLVKLTALLIDMDKMYYHSQNSRMKAERSYQIVTNESEATLSLREMECIFYLLRGCTFKIIAKNMHLSPRTVESYLNNIKFKLNCHTKSELIEYCLAKGYINYLPKTVLTNNVSGILHMIS